MEFVVVSLLVIIGLVYGSPVEEVEWLPPLNATENGKGNDFTNEIQSRIINGQRAQPGQFPWQAFLVLYEQVYLNWGWINTFVKNDNSFCGASLISKQHLITAAHCLNQLPLETYRITYPKLSNYVTDITVELALIAPISLPAFDEIDDFVGQTVITSGFGQTRYSTDDDLNYVSLKVITNKQCSYRMDSRKLIDETKICAYPDKVPHSSACFGDSGGPLVVYNSFNKQLLIGVTSFGKNKKCSGPTVFTRITSYLDFICQYATDLKYNCTLTSNDNATTPSIDSILRQM
ncbi:hypothetical protein O0L34_g6530 [Tuta absoluta]|nr:hypothetical protein O0L34_g6530 [Tuta absoluta]